MKYVIVTGGELFNKGAQAMSYICADEIAKRWPDARMLLLSTKDAKRDKKEIENYKFSIIQQPNLKELVCLRFSVIASAMAKLFKITKYTKWLEALNNSFLWLDISGYGLGSYWKPAKAVHYMLNVSVAKKWRIPMYLMPQSFGPFEYKGLQGSIANCFISHYLRYVKTAMAREQEGKTLLEKTYRITQVVKTPDMVLQNRDIDYANVFTEVPQKTVPQIRPHSVAIIPNIRNNRYGKERIYQLYNNIIDELLLNSFDVYLVYHAVEDLSVCRDIMQSYINEKRVHLVEEEIKCYEMDDFMKSFSFIVGSRFHSIVHAYKCHTPAIVIGWATKYQELLLSFSQTQFMFDARNDISKDNIDEALAYMMEHFQEEQTKIGKRLEEIQKGNVFDLIKL